MIIAFTVNNRPQYLRRTLESWSRVRGISDWPLLFSCEPGSPESVDVCRAASFAPGAIATHQTRQGVLGNAWRAVDLGFGTLHPYGPADFVILAEEDMVVSPDVLEYFTWCQRYRDDPNVLGITTYQHHEQPGGFAGVGPADWCSRDDQWHFWVWGTWRDRWERLLRDDWDFTYRENGGGPNQRGWDWRIRNLLVCGKGLTMIAPSMCRSQHIGEYGGTHAQPSQYEELLSRCYAGDDVPPQEYREASSYECDCCERKNVPWKLKGIGYLCEDCLPSWTWDYGRHPAAEEPLNHNAGRTCPFRRSP